MPRSRQPYYLFTRDDSPHTRASLVGTMDGDRRVVTLVITTTDHAATDDLYDTLLSSMKDAGWTPQLVQ